MKIHVAHSPDADDFFMFWPIRAGWLDCSPFELAFTVMDTEDLNTSAVADRFDVVAVSAAILPQLVDRFVLLASGASVGRGYGPKLVISSGRAGGSSPILAELQRATIAVPGKSTTAAMLVRALLPDARQTVVPLTPYRAVFDALRNGTVDAAAIIHEGQLAFPEFGCTLVEDLGKWWARATGLPLPVGVNIAHKRLGTHLPGVAALLKRSIRTALDRREEILPGLEEIDRAQGGKLRTARGIGEYLDLYANEDSYDLPQDGRDALVRLLTGPGEQPFHMEII